jgi:hypothetical protein
MESWGILAGEKWSFTLQIHQKEFGPESLEAAASPNLPWQLMGQHKRPGGGASAYEALAIRRRLLGEEHADTATPLSDLAAVREEGKVVEAEDGSEALRIRRKVGGNNSSQVADCSVIFV